MATAFKIEADLTPSASAYLNVAGHCTTQAEASNDDENENQRSSASFIFADRKSTIQLANQNLTGFSGISSPKPIE